MFYALVVIQFTLQHMHDNVLCRRYKHVVFPRLHARRDALNLPVTKWNVKLLSPSISCVYSIFAHYNYQYLLDRNMVPVRQSEILTRDMALAVQAVQALYMAELLSAWAVLPSIHAREDALDPPLHGASPG
jgi:hypothetical protein